MSLEYSMSVKLLTEHHLEFLSLKGSCTSSSESTLVKIPHCRKSHIAAHFVIALKFATYDSCLIDSLRPSQQLFSYVGTVFLSRTSTMCLVQRHNAVTPVRLEPATPRSRVKHSTTEYILTTLQGDSCTCIIVWGDSRILAEAIILVAVCTLKVTAYY